MRRLLSLADNHGLRIPTLPASSETRALSDKGRDIAPVLSELAQFWTQLPPHAEAPPFC